MPFNHKKSMRVFGNPFSHPFLVMRDSGGAIVGEIHGEWAKENYSAPVRRLLSIFHAAIIDENMTSVVASFAKNVMPPAIIHQTGERISPKAEYFSPMLVSSESVVKKVWDNLLDVLPSVNALRMPFYQYATPDSGFANCQVMLRKAMDLSGRFDDVPPLRFAQTGWTTQSKPDIKGP